MDNSFAPFLIIIISILFSRSINRKALQHLSDDEKVDIVDLTASQGKWMLPVLISALVGFYLIIQSGTLDKSSSLSLLMVLLIGVLSVQFFATHKKLTEMRINDAYLKRFKLAFLVRAIGLISFALLSYLQ